MPPGFCPIVCGKCAAERRWTSTRYACRGCPPRMPADAERRKIGKYNLIYLIVYDIIHLKNKATLYFLSTNTSCNIFLKSDIIK